MTAIRTVAVIGTGTIGASWSALFLGHGYDVIAYDPRADAEDRLRATVARLLPDARPPIPVAGGRLAFAASAERAAASADLIQENAPEHAEVKAELIAALEAAMPAHALIASSTTALMHSTITARAKAPERIVVAHPFNPPHLVPLVELVGKSPDCAAVRRAHDFYRTLGREPVILKKEAVGHLANRLQAALVREAFYVLQEGIADIADIDKAVKFGPGLRWAFMGPFQTYHLAGGEAGMRHYMEHLLPSQMQRWAALGTPVMDAAFIERVITGVEQAMAGRPVAEMAAERDRALKASLAALAAEEADKVSPQPSSSVSN
jgi:3-hydroxyacyl-CoA dehydrogenase